MTPNTRWLAVGERGSLAGMYFIVACHRLLGRRLCGYLIVPVVAYFFLTGRAARRASRDYLTRVHAWSRGLHPGGLARAPRWRDSFRHFYEFALNILDRISFFVGDTREFRTVVHGREHLERVQRDGRGALVLSAHLGSFDALRLVADDGGVTLNVAMFLRNARMINAVFRRLNAGRPLRIIDLERAAPHSVFAIRACLQRGEFVGMLADRVAAGDDGRVSRVPFLGGQAAIPQGPFVLANALKCPVLLMIALRADHRTYEVFVEPLAEPEAPPSADRAAAVDAFARHYARRLEHYCVRAPYQWFNFYEFWDAPGPEHAVTAERFPPVADLLPHAGRMVLLSSVLRHTERLTVCAVEIRPGTMFAEADGGVPAWVALEYMAQCIAAHGGLRARAAGEPVKRGVLLGTRTLTLHASRFAPGQRLEVEAAHVWGEQDFFSFACTVRDARTGTMLAEGTLTVARASGDETAVLPTVAAPTADASMESSS